MTHKCLTSLAASDRPQNMAGYCIQARITVSSHQESDSSDTVWREALIMSSADNVKLIVAAFRRARPIGWLLVPVSFVFVKMQYQQPLKRFSLRYDCLWHSQMYLPFCVCDKSTTFSVAHWSQKMQIYRTTGPCCLWVTCVLLVITKKKWSNRWNRLVGKR